MMAPDPSARPQSADQYLAALPPEPRAALQSLRETIAAHLPGTTECLSYAMPGFRHPDGKMIVGYAAFARHLGLYPHSGGIMAQITAETAPFKTSTSGILFTPETPLPPALIRRILDLRLAEIAAGFASPARARAKSPQ